MSRIVEKNEISINETMDRIECKLIDGKSISGLLERTFLPMEGEVAIRSEGKVHLLPLDQICCVLFKDFPENHDSLHMPGEKSENIFTRGNETYSVRLIHQGDSDNLLQGFMLYPLIRKVGIVTFSFLELVL